MTAMENRARTEKVTISSISPFVMLFCGSVFGAGAVGIVGSLASGDDESSEASGRTMRWGAISLLDTSQKREASVPQA